MLDGASNAETDSPLQIQSSSAPSTQPHSDDPNQDIDSSALSAVDQAKVRLFFTKGMIDPCSATPPDQHVMTFARRSEPQSGRTLSFSIIRGSDFSCLGWFGDPRAITGIGYCFYKDGSYYCGELSRGEKDGYGEFFDSSGDYRNGFWRRNSQQESSPCGFENDLNPSEKWENRTMLQNEMRRSSQIRDKYLAHQLTKNSANFICFKKKSLGISMRFRVTSRH